MPVTMSSGCCSRSYPASSPQCRERSIGGRISVWAYSHVTPRKYPEASSPLALHPKTPNPYEGSPRKGSTSCCPGPSVFSASSTSVMIGLLGHLLGSIVLRTGFAGGYLTLWKGCHEDTVLLPNAKVNSLYPFQSFMRIPSTELTEEM